ncbi:hypothetical protein GCM10020255_065290 [Rhodococcus baikonurensis]
MATRSEQAHNAAVEVYLDKFADYDKGKWIARTLKFQFTEGLTVGSYAHWPPWRTRTAMNPRTWPTPCAASSRTGTFRSAPTGSCA